MFITSFGEQNITYSCCSNFLIHLYMFYSEHIFEKLSVYGEYMQTRIQNGANFKVLSTNELSHR
ncbi:hypothetical protein EGT42_16665 [Acinetobacter haemolyticus]|nr:hypothetical protein EGT42_16665 [Acinetobacter haemolyticus]